PPPRRPSYTLSLHDALPISGRSRQRHTLAASSSTPTSGVDSRPPAEAAAYSSAASTTATVRAVTNGPAVPCPSLDSEYKEGQGTDRKSTRLNSSHVSISYAV